MGRELVGRFFAISLFFSPVTPNEILLKILDDVRSSKNCAAVFDLDSTLFCVSPRSQAILRELASTPEFQTRFPEASRALSTIEVLPTEYGIKKAMIRTGLNPSQELVDTVVTFWRAKFFSNSHMQHDLIYPGAEKFVESVHTAGADVYYLTGRNESLMRAGTMQNLRVWKFPDIPVERVMMKLNAADQDHQYKEERLRALASTYERVWFFENEPVIIHHVREQLPDVQMVYVDSTHSGKAEPPKGLMTLSMDFRLGASG